MVWAGRKDLKDFVLVWDDPRARPSPVVTHIPTGIQLWETRDSAQYDATRYLDFGILGSNGWQARTEHGARVILVKLTDKLGIPRDAFEELDAFRRAHGQHFFVHLPVKDMGPQKTQWNNRLVELYCKLSLISMDASDFQRGLPPCPDVIEFCPKNLPKHLHRTMKNIVPQASES